MTVHKRDRTASRVVTSRQRAGVVLFLLIVVLAVVGILTVSITQMVLARHRLQRVQMDALQAGELCEAGIERAAAQLAASEKYEGETWKPALDKVDDAGGRPAAVVIEVHAVEGQPARRQVSVHSTCGAGPHAAAHSQTITIDLSTLATEKQ